jgi:hypothetical protein
MKKHILLFLMTIVSTSLISFSRPQNDSLSALFHKYFAIKNALVAGDAAGAAKASADFVGITKASQPNFVPDASSIAASKDLAAQRTAFQSLSEKMMQLNKSTKHTSPVYLAFCPMKKAYWLTEEKLIKNPYYGSAMLSCGKIITQ